MVRRVNKKKVISLFVLIFSIFLFCIDIFMIYGHVDINKRKRDSFVGSYTESSTISYTVNLNENDYINSSNIGNSNSYVMKYTDSVLFNMTYDYISSIDMDTIADYEIYLIISGNYKRSVDNGDEIYSDKVLVESGSLNSFNNIISINKNIDVDINKYNQILVDLQKDIKLPLTGSLSIFLEVNTKDSDGNVINNYKEVGSMELLTEVYTVDAFNNDSATKDIYSDDLEISYIYLIILGIIFVICTIVSLVMVRNILENNSISLGQKMVNKYLRVYDDYIVNTNDYVDEDRYEVINILEFKELLTLAINHNCSIIYYNGSGFSVFYVIINNNLYKYYVKTTRRRNER